MLRRHRLRTLVLATFAAFALSYGLSIAGSLNEQDSYPFSLLKHYALDEKATDVALNQKMNATGVKTVQISTTSTNVEIEFVGSETAEIHLTGRFPQAPTDSSELLHAERIGDSLVIQLRDNPGNSSVFKFDFHRAEGVLKLQLPRTIQKTYMKTVSGTLALQGGSLARLDLQSVSGDCTTTDTKISSLRWRTTSGDLDTTGEVQEINAKSISGDLTFSLTNLDPQSSVQTVSGNIAFEFQAEPDVNIDYTTVSGSLSIDPSFGHLDFQHRKAHGRLGSGDGSIDAGTISGDFDVSGP